LQKKKLNF